MVQKRSDVPDVSERGNVASPMFGLGIATRNVHFLCAQTEVAGVGEGRRNLTSRAPWRSAAGVEICLTLLRTTCWRDVVRILGASRRKHRPRRKCFFFLRAHVSCR